MIFNKKFVRVEWLAFQKVVDLLREAGFDDSYFVSQSILHCDEGQAVVLAEMGRELHDARGKFVKNEHLHAKDFGLKDDIGEFAQPEIAQSTDQRYFIKRSYQFSICRQGKKYAGVDALVSFAKRTEQDDWRLIHECIVDHSRDGDSRYVIYRTDNEMKQLPRIQQEVV